MASYLHRTAQPPTLAAFRPWGSSAGAGRIRLAAANVRPNAQYSMIKFQYSSYKIQDFYTHNDVNYI